MRRHQRFVIAVVLLAAGCTSNGPVQGGAMTPAPDRPTITKAQALARIDQLIQGTVAAIDPKPKLELDKTSLADDRCVDPADGGSEDRIVVGRGYYLHGVPKDRLKDVAQKIKTYWEQQGHHIDGMG